jgi:hypothetical protein
VSMKDAHGPTSERSRERTSSSCTRLSGKISYLVYPDFEDDPHPCLLRSVKLSLRSRESTASTTRTALTRPSCIARRRSFIRAIPISEVRSLTQQEEKHGLLEDTNSIGTRMDGSAGSKSADSRFVPPPVTIEIES